MVKVINVDTVIRPDTLDSAARFRSTSGGWYTSNNAMCVTKVIPISAPPISPATAVRSGSSTYDSFIFSGASSFVSGIAGAGATR